MIVVARTAEVVEGHHLQVWPRENVSQLFAEGVEDAYPRLLPVTVVPARTWMFSVIRTTITSMIFFARYFS